MREFNKEFYKKIILEANKFMGRKKNILTDFGSEHLDDNYPAYASSDESEVASESKLDKDTKYDFQQFTNLGSGIYTLCGKTTGKLPAGVYTISIPQSGIPFFITKDIKSDEWLQFRNSEIEKVLSEIEKFWKSEERFKSYGVLHRRGYLLYGPAGSGKTILIKQIMTKIIEDDGLVFFCNSSPSFVVRGIEFYRKIEPKRPIVVVMEDIDSIIQHYGEDSILSYLDGEDSNDRIFTISTTNYPEKLDKRIVQRPRRFDKIVKIGLPNAEMREYYFQEKLKIEDKEELEKWVKATKDFSFAAMTEMLISVKCLDVDFDEAKDRNKSMMTTTPDSNEYEKDLKASNNISSSLGFGVAVACDGC